MTKKSVVVLGGGVAGLTACFSLVKKGIPTILLEKESFLGGVATSTQLPDGRKIPLVYHHINANDEPLIKTLKELGLASRVRWRRSVIVANVDGKCFNLGNPFDVLKLERLSFFSRLRYLFFGARCLLTRDWQGWQGRSVTEVINQWADNHVLQEIFTPLVDIKFGLSTDEVDAAWLGQRLSKREGASAFGYIPNTSWTDELCQTFKKKIIKRGGEIFLTIQVKRISIASNRIDGVITNKGDIINPLAVVSTLPPPVFVPLLKRAKGPSSWLAPLEKIRYISSYSLYAGTPFDPSSDYWTIALHPRRIFGACFNLSALNETLVTKKDKSVVNLFTNVPFNKFPWTNKDYSKKTQQELSTMVGREVSFNWIKTSRINFSSPIFDRDYTNPPVRLGNNLFLAGIYTTYPKFSSTGSAIESGKIAAQALASCLKSL